MPTQIRQFHLSKFIRQFYIMHYITERPLMILFTPSFPNMISVLSNPLLHTGFL